MAVWDKCISPESNFLLRTLTLVTKFLVGFLSFLLALPACAQQSPPGSNPAILQIRVIDGQGAIYGLGSRATRGVTVLVTDETGKPVSGATVSFTLPASGATGTFANGAKTEIAATQIDGRASVWGMQWNHTPGSFEIRVTAVKGQARAGTVAGAVLSDSVSDPALRHASGGSGKRWLWITLAVGGAAAAGLAGLSAGKGSTGSATAPGTPSLSIGTPGITLGRN